MNDWKTTTTLLACWGIFLAVSPSVSADYIGVTTVYPDDPDTEFLCTQGNGAFVPGPLTVCNVYVTFSDPADRLLSFGNADLQVYNGAIPDVFFQHPFNIGPLSPPCGLIPAVPDLICDTFFTIGLDCGPRPPGQDTTGIDGDFDADGWCCNGHLLGGGFNADPSNGQGDAGNYPDLQVLILQSSVAQGLRLFGDTDVFWRVGDTGEVFAEVDVPVECAATCGSCPTDSDGDGDTDAADLAVLLGNWGPGNAGHCLDADDDGLIGAFDLAVLLGAWGPCL